LNQLGQNQNGQTVVDYVSAGGVRQTNVNGMMVQASESDLNKIYLDFGESVPGNNQGNGEGNPVMASNIASAPPHTGALKDAQNHSLNGSN